jgi:CHASE1-domain containing sensor protein
MSFGLLFFQTKIPSLFFLYPVLLLAGEFLSGRDVRLLTVLIASFAILASTLHRGPFPYFEGDPFALSHPLFLFSLGMTSLAITAFRRAGSLRLPGTTLVLFWVLGHLATTVVESADVRQEQQHLEKAAETAADQIFDHIRAFESTLRGGAGLFVTLDKVSERNWRKYYRNLHLPDVTNGLRSISAIFPVRTNGRTQYRVKFVEPSRQAWARADLTLDPVRKQALDEARKTNRITTSRKVGILPKKSGFEMYAPIFSETNHHLGWIAGSFDAELFFSSALRNAGPDIDVFIVDADPKQGGQLFYSTTGKEFQPSLRDVKLAVGRGSQPFHVFVRPSSTFFLNRNSVAWVAFVAALVALLGGSLTSSVTARSQEIKASENRMIAVIDQSPFGMLLFAPDGKVRKVNRAWMELWNLSVKETEDVVLSNYNLLQDPVLIESGITPSSP